MKYINAVTCGIAAGIILSCAIYIAQLPIDPAPIDPVDYVSRESTVIYSPPHDSYSCVETEVMDSATQADVSDALGDMLDTVSNGQCATLTIIHP